MRWYINISSVLYLFTFYWLSALNTCGKVGPCLRYRESSSCDSEGKRQVCISINNAPECVLVAPSGATGAVMEDIVNNVCFANGEKFLHFLHQSLVYGTKFT